MSRFELQSHALWYCLYHIVCVLKYRYRILVGKVAVDVRRCIMIFSGKEVYHRRTEHSSRPCAYAGEGATEVFAIRVRWNGEG